METDTNREWIASKLDFTSRFVFNGGYDYVVNQLINKTLAQLEKVFWSCQGFLDCDLSLAA